MAKPGSQQASRIAHTGSEVLDLAALKPLDPLVRAGMQCQAEVQAKMRCGGCRERIESGVRLTGFAFQRDRVSGAPIAGVFIEAACKRDGCSHWADVMADDKVAAVEHFEITWVDPDPYVKMRELAEKVAEKEAGADG